MQSAGGPIDRACWGRFVVSNHTPKLAIPAVSLVGVRLRSTAGFGNWHSLRVVAQHQTARSGGHAQGAKKAQQAHHGNICGICETLDQAGGQLSGLYWRHKPCALRLPEGGEGKALEPPLAPARNGARGHVELIAEFNRSAAEYFASLGQQHHSQGNIDTSAQKAHRRRCAAPSALATAKAPAESIVIEHLPGAALGFARVVGLVQHALTAMGANRTTHLVCDIDIHWNQ